LLKTTQKTVASSRNEQIDWVSNGTLREVKAEREIGAEEKK